MMIFSSAAAANALPAPVDEALKQERLERLMTVQAAVSAAKLRQRIGKRQTVMVDEVTDEGVIARSYADAPDIDGVVLIKDAERAKAGDFLEVEIIAADEHDLHARAVASP